MATLLDGTAVAANDKNDTNETLETGTADYAELHCLSNFSFLHGASHPEELVAEAAALGYRGIAITDECSLSGVVRAHLAARDHGIRLIIGAEFNLVEGEKLVLLAPDRIAYGQLARLITRARRRSSKGHYRLGIDDLDSGVERCLGLWIPMGEDFSQLATHGQLLRHALPRLWVALELFQDGDDADKIVRLLGLSSHLALPMVASNGALMHQASRKPLQDVLTAIRQNTSVAALGHLLDSNRERHLRPLSRLCRLYPAELLAESIAILDRCSFSLDELRYEYPEEVVPPGRTPAEHLAELTWAGAAERWPDGVPDDVSELIRKELALIAELSYEHYFLTVHDIVSFARSRSILCQGRGSAANSAVCYCLGITEVDPARMRVLFERFVSKERHEPPDIDVDFEHERREEVIQYIYKRYSRERAALAATLITYRPKSAIRDVGKALGLAPDLIDLLAKSLAWWDKQEELERRCKAAGIDPTAPVVQQFLILIRQILGFPRHLSQHVGGFVISRGPLAELVPVENAAMADRTVIQWDKTDLEALGLLKVDVLGLGMLTAIRKALAHLNAFGGQVSGVYGHPYASGSGQPLHQDESLLTGSAETGHPPRHCSHGNKAEASPLDTHLTVSTIPPEDPAVYRMLQRGDSVGVFQVESRAQMSMLPRLKPACFYDLVIQVAIVRPGPIQGDMVHPYLRRRQGLESVSYSSDGVRSVLERTLGIPIFQEQVIELAMVAAGFSAGEADQLRRAMAAWQRRGGLEHFEHKLIRGMLERGHDREFAERIFQQIKGFGEYGFPESHAASFALLVYVSAWLKCHHPAAFCCGLLNSLPMGFYSASQLIQDVRRHGVEVRPVDVQNSARDHRLEADAAGQPALRLGLRLVKGLGEAAGLRIAAARPFRDVKDLAQRATLSAGELQCLARAGALQSLSGHRHQAHWDVSALTPAAPLWKPADQDIPFESGAQLAAPDAPRNLIADYRYLGLTLGPHPLSMLRDHPRLRGCRRADDLTRCRHGQLVRIAGLVTGRQRPGSASGVMFVTLEDETGNSNVVVWSSVLDRYRAALLQGQLIRVKGIVEREGSVIHVVAGHIDDETTLLAELSGRSDAQAPFNSRDFH